MELMLIDLFLHYLESIRIIQTQGKSVHALIKSNEEFLHKVDLEIELLERMKIEIESKIKQLNDEKSMQVREY